MLDYLKSDIAVKLLYNNDLDSFVNSEEDYSILYNAIAMLPPLTDRVIRILKEDDIRVQDSQIVFAALSYVFNPYDIIGGDGLVAYLDDCVIFYSVIAKILNEEIFYEMNVDRSMIESYYNTSLKYIPLENKEEVKAFLGNLLLDLK